MKVAYPNLVLFIAILALSGCDKPSAEEKKGWPPTPLGQGGPPSVSQDQHGQTPRGKFEKQIYRTPEGNSSISVISAEEIEFSLSDGRILLCKYTAEPERLRVVLNALGSQEV